jgi:hypothetical protein
MCGLAFLSFSFAAPTPALLLKLDEELEVPPVVPPEQLLPVASLPPNNEVNLLVLR